jgi:creatinine amidohydrolase
MPQGTPFRQVVLFPTGSHEYHGTELPSETDTVIADAVARDIEGPLGERTGLEVSRSPILPYGFSPEHAGFPNTAWASHEAYYRFVRELLFSIAADGDLIVIVNWHGGNVRSLAALENDFNYEHPRSKAIAAVLDPPSVQALCEELFGEFDQHAGSVEASLMAYHLGLAARSYDTPRMVDLDGALRFFRTIELSPHGVVKRTPTIEADPEKGRRVHESIVAEVVGAVVTTIANLGPFMPDDGA